MKKYAMYNKVTGDIVNILSAPNEQTADLNATEDIGYATYSYDENDVGIYKVNVFTKEVESRATQSLTATPSTITADGSEKSVITGINSGSRADWFFNESNQGDISIPGHKINFCTDIVGTHDIVVKNPGWLDTTVTITATSP